MGDEPMKVYTVENGDGTLLAIFKTKAKAKRFVKDIGMNRWDEGWYIKPVKLNAVGQWLLAGNEKYRGIV
jgi:hypothetical protein